MAFTYLKSMPVWFGVKADVTAEVAFEMEADAKNKAPPIIPVTLLKLHPILADRGIDTGPTMVNWGKGVKFPGICKQRRYTGVHIYYGTRVPACNRCQ